MRAVSLAVISICLLVALIGCERISMPYVMKTDRVDQKMEAGNRGYLRGTPPPPKERGDLKRPLVAVDIDLISINKAKGASEEASQTTPAKAENQNVATEKASPKEESIK